MATFFEQQDAARRRTKILVVLFALAVLAVISAVALVVGFAWLAVTDFAGARPRAPARLADVPSGVYLWAALGTAATIFVVSLWNVARLAGGGRRVAEMVGARRVRPDTTDLLERRYLNVVEEMAIAAGMRVPAAYVMDSEAGINAFAAGYEPHDAVVAVTRGALEKLTRDELQGVIGHEFSHILNGDMRLDIRMLGVLAGIVFVGQVGEFLLRSQRGGGRSRGSGPLLLVGLGLLVVGYVGLFFARLIKAAAARQREFLADAASVQFTRNPEGIAGALECIRTEAEGALVRNLHAEDLSHMFFAESVKLWFEGLFATHPPIEERIARVHPRFDRAAWQRRRAAVSPAEAAAPQPAVSGRETAAAVLGQAGRRAGDLSVRWRRSAGESAALVGTLDAQKVDHARRLLGAFPAEFRERLRTRDGARAALLSLVLAHEERARQVQIGALDRAGLDALAGEALEAARHTASLGPAYRLPIVDLALPPLKAAAEDYRREALRALEALVEADRRISLDEFVVLALVREELLPQPPPSGWPLRIPDLEPQAALLLALVAHAGVRKDATGERAEALAAAIAAGAAEMGIAPPALEAVAFTLEKVNAALHSLRRLAPLQKAILVRGLFAAATHDGTIRVAEAELLRLVGAVLDCPLPPLLEMLDPTKLAP